MTNPSPSFHFWARALWQAGAVVALAVGIALTVNHLRPDGLALTGNPWAPEKQLTLESGESLAIPFEEARALFFTQGAVFLDARSAEAYASGHIAGALNLPSEEFAQYFPQVMSTIPREAFVITYCDGESCSLSKELAQALLDEGYTNVRVLVNGWSVWQQHNLPVE